MLKYAIYPYYSVNNLTTIDHINFAFNYSTSPNPLSSAP